MNASNSGTGKGTGPDHQTPGSNGPGNEIPKRPADTTASGEAKNDTGEDNQRQKGERPAQDYVRH